MAEFTPAQQIEALTPEDQRAWYMQWQGKPMSPADFLLLPETMIPVELVEGEVSVSPSPTYDHQKLVLKLGMMLNTAQPKGEACISPLDVHIDDHNVYQPDVFWVSPQNTTCRLVDGKYWQGAPDLVIEILSAGSGRRDKKVKFEIYRRAGIREYWSVDPANKVMDVWRRHETQFVWQGAFGSGDTLTGTILGDALFDLRTFFPT